ncbi:MAG: dihydroneopterin aldolase [Acidobacteria bacterium]|nr:dihydroneopterin aldolase [Acidobacteriota bacterium]
MLGTVKVSGIRFHAFHGLTKLERQIGVRYRIDVEMDTDIATPARTDEIADAIDYRGVHELVVRIGRGNSFRLIETLVARIAHELLAAYPASRVRVSVDKETPVLDGMVDSVGVEVTLNREEL